MSTDNTDISDIDLLRQLQAQIERRDDRDVTLEEVPSARLSMPAGRGMLQVQVQHRSGINGQQQSTFAAYGPGSGGPVLRVPVEELHFTARLLVNHAETLDADAQRTVTP